MANDINETSNTAPQVVVQEEIQGHTYKDSTFYVCFRQFCRNKVALVGMIISLLMVLMAVFAPVIAPYDYAAVSPMEAHMSPCAEHIFGTDNLGRDIFSRIVYGARYSLSISLVASIAGALVGIVLGLLAGFFGGVVETLIMRFCDVLQSIPGTLLSIIISVSLGTGIVPTICAIAIGSVPMFARLLRAQMMTVREEEYVEAAKAIDCSNVRIAVRHILPNCMAPLIVTFTTSTSMKITNLAGLSYLGLGIQEPTPEWGAMINAGKTQLRYHPHEVMFPGLFIAILVLCLNLVGDGLRDALDPKLRS